jgi:zinc/manganese transport system substrate-binding protein
MRRLIILVFLAVAACATAARAAPINLVAAENFYGDIARQIGGDNLSVTSILSNPDQDPHEFEASASTARAIANSELAIFNGADYDPWMTKLLSASPSATRIVIEVAPLVHKKPGDNPHLWYLPSAGPAVADALATALSKLDPAHASSYREGAAAFARSLDPLRAKIAELRANHAGTPVTATEPVFGYMADAIGLKMRNAKFQLAIMNDTEPSAADIAAFEKDLRTHAVKVLFYNNQTEEPLTQRMKALAQSSGVPVVGVSETEPTGKTYQEWMLSQLDDLATALAPK